jgi:hypothetical protein
VIPEISPQFISIITPAHRDRVERIDRDRDLKIAE